MICFAIIKIETFIKRIVKQCVCIGGKDLLNYKDLNDVEFEYLCKDIMQEMLGVELYNFAPGADGGIDLTDNVNTKNIVVQIKHYENSTISTLITNIKKEIPKVEKLNPNQYYICCSKELSPQKVDEIYSYFSTYMNSPANIITLNEIDNFLTDSKNLEILKKHYKLWIESTGILQDIFNNNIFIDCETLLANIENEKNLFVYTSAFSDALKCLQNNKVLFITGNPGVGKSITSKMLILHYANNGYQVRFTRSACNLSDLKKSLSRNPNVKEIILIDDCFGQAYFEMKDSQNEELISLINYVNISPNKLLILNSRVTILQEAKERKPELVKCFKNEKFKVNIIDMSVIPNIEKAKILYNHMCFYNISKKHFNEIKKERRYYDIINHPNYSPRIIEFVSEPSRCKSIVSSDYYDFVIQQLDNPREIWKDEYEKKLQKADRLLLLTIYSLSDSFVNEELVKNCFERRISSEKDIDKTINQYEASLSRLSEGFVRIVDDKGVKKLSMVNPSINDYLDGRMAESHLEKQMLIDNSYSVQQKERLLSENEFDEFVLTLLINNKLDDYLFNSEEEKETIVAYYVGKYKILNPIYYPYILNYLLNPRVLKIYGNTRIPYFRIIKPLFDENVCNFYKLKDFVYDINNLESLLSIFDIDEMTEFVKLIDKFFTDDNRDVFIQLTSEYLQTAINDYCSDIDADEYDAYVDNAISMSSCYDEELGEMDVDIGEAVEYIEDDIISDVIDEIEDKLSNLPKDIQEYKEYTQNLTFDIWGVEELVVSALDVSDYDTEFHEHSRNLEKSDNEIDYIFNRD